jgi:Na+-transporting methylmalonyl-CoA/oxaloacetate decarboxylase gamma subunit
MSVFAVCVIAFGTVLILLTFMAVVMKILTRIFPVPEAAQSAASAGTDAAVESAIAQAVTTAFPGAWLSRIREISRRT